MKAIKTTLIVVGVIAALLLLSILYVSIGVHDQRVSQFRKRVGNVRRGRRRVATIPPRESAQNEPDGNRRGSAARAAPALHQEVAGSSPAPPIVVGKRVAIAGVLLVCLAAVVNASLAATPASTPMQFEATLTASLTENRHLETTEAGAGCSVTTTLDTSVSVALRTVKPSLVTVRRHANGATWLRRAIRHIAASAAGAAGGRREDSCSGADLLFDCARGASHVRDATTALLGRAGGPVRLRRLTPALRTVQRCVLGFPALPRLDLVAARGRLSPARLFDPAVSVIRTDAHSRVRIPLRVENGAGEAFQRVDWRMTLRRVSG